MLKILIFVAALSGFSGSVHALECPQTHSDLMRYFGRALLPANGLAVNPGSSSDEKIQSAIDGIGSAIQCASQTLCEEGLALLPPRLRGTPDKYREFTEDFIALLKDYRRQFEAQLALRPEERTLQDLNQTREAISEIVRNAHSAL